MFKSIGTLSIICALCLGMAQTASAGDRSYDRHDTRHHRHVIVHRDRYMPHWMHHDRRFVSWYHRTPLRHNHYLAWWQLFEIYGWERRYDHRGHHPVHYGSRHRDYDWYRGYWHKRDRPRHDRRGHSKRKWRDRDDD